MPQLQQECDVLVFESVRFDDNNGGNVTLVNGLAQCCN